MGKAAVIYKSKYGYTKKYAQWIAQELAADLLEADKTKPAKLQDYDVIVYGGGLYAGGVNGISLITRNFEHIGDKAIYLFTVGVSDVADQQNVEKIRTGLGRALPPEMQESIMIYHLRGGMDYSNMSFVHRRMMDMMVKMLRKNPEDQLSQEDRVMIEAFGQRVDFTDRSSITALIDDIKSSGRL